jgi:hypothetical protein
MVAITWGSDVGAEDALSVLAGHGWIAEVNARPRIVRLLSEGAGR